MYLLAQFLLENQTNTDLRVHVQPFHSFQFNIRLNAISFQYHLISISFSIDMNVGADFQAPPIRGTVSVCIVKALSI